MSRVAKKMKEDYLLDTRYSNIQVFSDQPRHRWYSFKEAFTPYIVETAIKDADCSQNDIIIDPFCGSGTTPLVASLRGSQTIGFEVNPFLAFLGRTKLSNAAIDEVNEGLNSVRSGIQTGIVSPLESYSTFSQAGGSGKWLFNEAVLRAFEGGWQACKELPSNIQDPIRLSLITAAMDNCNAYRDGKCLRYRKNWQDLNFNMSSFKKAFDSRMAIITQDLTECPSHGGAATIHCVDVREAVKSPLQTKFKLCVTSPPYLNSFDYTDVYRPELFLGKFLTTSEELKALRLNTIRSHVQASWRKPRRNSFGPLYKACMKTIDERAEDLWDSRIPLMIQAYFEDMEHLLRSLRTSARPDASLWMIVSTSAYVGVEIPVDLIIAYIGDRVGWFLREVNVLKYLRTSGQHWNKWAKDDERKPRLRESVIVFDASYRRLK